MDPTGQSQEALLHEVTVLRQRVRQLETELRNYRSRYEILFERSNDPMLTLTLDGTFTSLNRAMEDLLGWPRQELLGQHYGKVATPASLQQWNDRTRRALAGETGLSRIFESEIRRRDGRVLPIECRTGFIRDSQGTPVGIYGTYRDISARKQADAALRASEHLNRRIVEAVPGGVVQVTREGSIVRANAEAQRILGLSYDELRCCFIADFEHQTLWEDGTPCAVQDYPVTRCLASGQAQPPTTLGVRRPDGTVAWAVFTAIPLTDPETGETTGAVVTFLDITERRRLEAQLRQAQKMEAIGTLAGGIAHDFNNILAAIIGFTELACFDLPAESPVRQTLQEVLTAGQRARDLVRQILTFSRQDTQTRKPVRVPHLVQEALTMLRASLPATIEIHQHLLDETGTVMGNPTQLHQVLMNLCANAEHAMRDEGGVLDVRVETVDVEAAFAARFPELRPGPYVRIGVRDSGHGIEPDVLDRIFDPFFTTKRVGEGTGMGLAVVHGIVTGHGGAITVDSTPGVGTSFDIYLPRIDAEVEPASSVDEAVKRGQGCVLFVDDEEPIVQLGREMLTRLGYEAVVTTRSADALEAFQAAPNRFDVVITDQTMPGMTGEALIKAIRRLRPDIPVILCTGFSHTMDADRAQALGVDAFLLKPLQAQELGRTLQRVLARRGG